MGNNYLYALVAVPTWISGVVLANGFWSTTFAVVLPFLAWYLFIEKAMQCWGWV